MPDAPSPLQTAAALRGQIYPSHGAFEIYRRVLDGLAVLIEQNERIIELLGPTEKVK